MLPVSGLSCCPTVCCFGCKAGWHITLSTAVVVLLLLCCGYTQVLCRLFRT